MANKNSEDKTAATPAAVKKPAWKLALIIFLALIVLGGIGFAAYEFVLKKGLPEKQAKKESSITSAIWSMDPFVVNLLDNHGGRYLKVVIQLEIQDDKTLPEFNASKPRLRDAVIDLISAKSYKELMEPGGKQQLRDELLLRLNANLKEGKVAKIYFTEFIIQ